MLCTTSKKSTLFRLSDKHCIHGVPQSKRAYIPILLWSCSHVRSQPRTSLCNRREHPLHLGPCDAQLPLEPSTSQPVFSQSKLADPQEGSYRKLWQRRDPDSHRVPAGELRFPGLTWSFHRTLLRPPFDIYRFSRSHSRAIHHQLCLLDRAPDKA